MGQAPDTAMPRASRPAAAAPDAPARKAAAGGLRALGPRAARGLAGLVLAGALAACAPVYSNHGYVPAAEDLAQIEVGVTTREDVAALVGRPSSQGLLEGSGWYYVGSRWVRNGIRAPQELSREGVAISFDAGGRVSNVERFGLQDGRLVALSRRVTDTGVGGVTLLTQLLRNFGRISTEDLTEN